MNSKITTYVLGFLLAGSLVFAFYTYDRAKKLETEKTEWQIKYEEALIDAEDSGQRIEKMKEELEKALQDSELHRKQAEDALTELKKHKR
ncbi:MAG TPA: hypothetical protein VGK39_02610 [Cyclobacteriaceae bacterium]